MAIVRTTHGARRSEVLAWLEQATSAISVADLARSTGLHVNTARFHLDRLVQEGRAERQTESGGVRGRPRVLYSALPPETDPRSYRLLAEMLTGVISSLDPEGVSAGEAGRAWGRQLVADAPVHDEDALQRLDAALGTIGFGQTHQDDATGIQLRVHECPVREVAAQHPDAVCTLHRGLIEGALEALSVPLEVDELIPFVAPRMCVARLRGPSLRQ